MTCVIYFQRCPALGPCGRSTNESRILIGIHFVSQILIGRSKRQSIPTELTYAWHAFSLRHGPRGRSSSYSKGSEYKPVSSFEYALLNGTNLCTNSRSPIWYASTYLAWSPFFFLVSTGAVQQRKCRSRVLRPKSSDFE